MTVGEKLYSGIVIVCAGFLLASIAMFHFVLIPGDEDPGIFYFVVSIMWIIVFGLAASVVTNLCYRSLLIVPTVVQCVILCCMVYLIPIAIWGGVLLYFRLQREKANV